MILTVCQCYCKITLQHFWQEHEQHWLALVTYRWFEHLVWGVTLRTHIRVLVLELVFVTMSYKGVQQFSIGLIFTWSEINDKVC